MLGFTVCLIFIFRQATYRLSNKISGSLPNYQRRKLFLRLTRLSFIGVTAPTFAFATHQAFLEPELKEVDIPLAHLPEALVGFRICQLSDLHLTPDYDPAALRKLILRINDLRPDIIALTGDITDGYTHEFKDLFTLLASLKARLGVFFVTGNHEYYWGAEAWCDAYSEIGFQVMNNRHQVLEVNEGKILIAGISDPSAKYHLAHHASSADAALRDAPLDMVRILLAHQPASLYQASHLSYDLQLSGHTHGGQLLPLGWLARLSQPCLEGLNWIASRWVYVNCGAGYSGPPLRLGTRSEIAVLRLVSK